MKPAKPVNLAIVRAKQESPVFRLLVEVWQVPRRRYYWEHETTSRIGEPSLNDYASFAAMLEDYAKELRRFGQAKYANTAKAKRRRVRARRGRR